MVRAVIKLIDGNYKGVIAEDYETLFASLDTSEWQEINARLMTEEEINGAAHD